jgi:methionyl-tRNA formyltransferase
MKIALFASDTVGNEIARFFGDNREPLTCLVLDSKDSKGLNTDIIANSRIGTAGRILYSDSLRDRTTLDVLEEHQLDLILLAWWPYILKKDLIRIPRLGCLNFHPSFLPYNRGKHYNFWTIVEGTPFGVTLHWVDEAVDAGDIAWQSHIEKSWEDNGGTLYLRAQQEIVKLFKEKFGEIKSGLAPRMPQELQRGSFHRTAELEEASRIDLDKHYRARDLLNLLRARTFPCHPGAWFTEDGTKYEAMIKIRKVTDVNNKQ